MSNDTQQIALIKSQTLARMVEITSQPKPTYQIDGQTVSWNEYLSRLQGTVDWCNAKLASQQPVEFQTRGYS
jgi:hypothetical protein